ncbi:hypothetical protein [Chryseolinea soli]|uniref:Uncharacterized protein n=1 Tax=Chryseolinea soli TaxID=2321403 RepID=A0A385SWU6_9BACT|nr:hypothetical protein [Chryseolinea soli]AYB33258.1 hypothetical protein D4L85_22920 [Chryseolinea soli]
MRACLLFQGFLLFCFLACEKPANLGDGSADAGRLPIALAVSLHDSLPQKAMTALGLSDVTGVKVQYIDGRSASYFVYPASRQVALNTIAGLPFSKHAKIADTLCRPVATAALQYEYAHLSSVESQYADFFWQALNHNVEAYECIKAPWKHTLLVSKTSGQVLHRIELLSML